MADPICTDVESAMPDVTSSETDLSIELLVHRYHGDVYRYAYRLSGTAADAEDLAQQTFLLAQQHLPQLRSSAKARGWLLAIVRSCYLKSCRRQRPVSAASIELDVDGIPADESHDDIDSQLIQTALDQLPDELKLVVVMFYFDEMSYKEIAAECQIAIGTVMSRLSRAKSRLRGILLPHNEPIAGPVPAIEANRMPATCDVPFAMTAPPRL